MQKYMIFAAALALTLLWNASASAAGLGRLTVKSGLGAPLRAEIQLFATQDEAASMKARLVYPESRQALGSAAQPIPQGINLTLGRDAAGQATLLVTSNAGISTPTFVLPIEISWNSGSFVREYSVLLDGPRDFPTPLPQPITENPYAFGGQGGGIVINPPALYGGGIGADAMSFNADGAWGGELPPESFAARGGMRGGRGGGGARSSVIRVRRGDTLSKIAIRYGYRNASMERMLVAMLRANPNAFIGGNMNLLKNGVSLHVPSAAKVRAVARDEARALVREQAGSFSSGTVRAAAADDDENADTTRSQSGRVKSAANAEEKKGGKPAPGDEDQLEVSNTKNGKGKLGAADDAMDKLARGKALAEANSRLAELEKNLDDINKLAAAKTGGDASKGTTSSDTSKTAANTGTATDATKVVPAEKKPVTPPRALAPPPEATTGLFSENTMLLTGLVMAVLLLAGFFAYAAVRKTATPPVLV